MAGVGGGTLNLELYMKYSRVVWTGNRCLEASAYEHQGRK